MIRIPEFIVELGAERQDKREPLNHVGFRDFGFFIV